MSLPEQPCFRAGCIPVQPSVGDHPATSLHYAADRPYRRSSFSPASSSAYSPLQVDSKYPPRLSQCVATKSVIPTVRHNEELSQQDQGTISDESESAAGSDTSSNSSTHGVETPRTDEMLDSANLSTSSSSSCRNGLAVPTTEAPGLPARSSLRLSRLLTAIPQKKAATDDQPMLPHAAPHQIYLSSEEDASSSADDFSDAGEDNESDGEGSDKQTQGRLTRRREDTARIVAVVFHGKPSMITLSPRRSMSPSSSELQQAGACILRTVTEPTLSRPRSISPTSSTMTLNRPPRLSSMMPTYEKGRPTFLNIDPFAKPGEDPESKGSPKTSPTGMLRKTLSLVKKRSKQNLQQSESQPTRMEQVSEVEEKIDAQEGRSLEEATQPSPSYQDIMRGARRCSAISVTRSEASSSKSPKNRFRSGLSLGRQRSVRA